MLETRAERHLGDPLRPFLELYRELDTGRLAGIAATGVYGERLGEPALGGVPEEIAQEQAAAWLYPDGPLNVVRVGGGGYSVLTRDASGNVRYEANERCSAGHGRDGGGPVRPARPLAGRGRRAGGGQPGRRHRHEPLRRVRQERAHPLRQSGRAARAHLPRALRGRRPQRPQPVRQEQDRRPRGADRARGLHRTDRRPHGRAQRRAGRGRGARPASSRRSARCASRRPEPAEAQPGRRDAAAGTATRRPSSRPIRAELVRPVRSRIGRLEPAQRGPGSVVRLEDAQVAPAAGDEGRPGGARPRPRLHRLQGRARRRRLRRRPGERLPPHRGQPGRGRPGSRRGGRGDGAEPGRGRGRHRLRPRRRGDRVPRGVPGPRRAPHGAERDRRARDRGRRDSTRTAAAASPSSRSAARTPSSSTSRTDASSTPT